MTKLVADHLQNINVNALVEFRKNAFIPHTWKDTPAGRVYLGVNGIGNFVVRLSDKIPATDWVYSKPETAIKKYSELISE